jgi:beta-lactamase superfamily II metal-dependent hydrolase
MDGGVALEVGYLRGFLAALGNTVDVWFLSHPHSDHIGALNEILKNPDGIEIKSVYHSKYSSDFYDSVELGSRDLTVEFYENLDRISASGCKVTDVTEPGLVIEIDQIKFKIIDIKNETVKTNAYNNSCMVIRAWDSVRSVVFLGDAGLEQGDRLLASPFRDDLNCDFLQLAHHGQRGVSKDFYRTIKFDACLWPTPLWLYNNDAGNGYNTHTWETVEIRQLMEELGITKHFFGWQGLHVIL